MATQGKTDIPAKSDKPGVGDVVLFADQPGQMYVISDIQDDQVIVGKPGQNGTFWVHPLALAHIGPNPHGSGQFWSFRANWGKVS